MLRYIGFSFYRLSIALQFPQLLSLVQIIILLKFCIGGNSMEEVIDYTPQVSAIIQRQAEVLEVLGNVQGLLIFFTVVILCWLVYRFFRMFF